VGRLFANIILPVSLAVASAAASAAAPAQLAAFRPSGAPRATGYVRHWRFKADDTTPIVTIMVSPAGTFSFSYRLSACGRGAFHITGRFTSTPFRNEPFEQVFAGANGYLVTFHAAGSCQGAGQSAGNTFTWYGARGVGTGFVENGKWPDTRMVTGVMTQVATTASSRGSLQCDWAMSAVY
jgi:hypothetical protein